MFQALQVSDLVEILEGAVSSLEDASNVSAGPPDDGCGQLSPVVITRLLAAIIRAIDTGSLSQSVTAEVYRCEV